MTKEAKLERVFKIGSIELPDPDPSISDADQAVRLYSGTYPFLLTATLEEPTIQGQRMIYEITKNVKSKG